MKIDRAQLDALNASASYQSLPMQSALEKGYKVWWSQVGEMTRTAASMIIWEIATALESCFETYEGENLRIELQWVQPRDMDPQGKDFDMRVNGRRYQGCANCIEKELEARLRAADGLRALALVEQVASSGILSNRKFIAQELNEAFSQSVLTSANQARLIKRERAPEVSARIEAIWLDMQATPTPPHRSAATRF